MILLWLFTSRSEENLGARAGVEVPWGMRAIFAGAGVTSAAAATNVEDQEALANVSGGIRFKHRTATTLYGLN